MSYAHRLGTRSTCKKEGFHPIVRCVGYLQINHTLLCSYLLLRVTKPPNIQPLLKLISLLHPLPSVLALAPCPFGRPNWLEHGINAESLLSRVYATNMEKKWNELNASNFGIQLKGSISSNPSPELIILGCTCRLNFQTWQRARRHDIRSPVLPVTYSTCMQVKRTWDRALISTYSEIWFPRIYLDPSTERERERERHREK